MNLTELANQVQKELGKREMLQEQLTKANEEITFLIRDRKNTEQAQIIIQQVAKNTQSELEFHISDIVTTALYSVLDEPYEFKVNFLIKNNRTVAELKLLRKGMELDPKDSTGGGVCDIASFALRIAAWKLKTPKVTNTIIIDEPFKHLSRGDYEEKAAEIIKMLSEKLKIQFIINTHNDKIEAIADKTFKFKLVNGVTVVKEN
jgi:DNA repair exonuclease SbcCD ATPase subunit